MTLPMGRLDEALNTFWQLFFRPDGTTVWSNHVQATATATNGGLVLASSGAGRLVVGIRPSLYLKFTPIIATSNDAASWSNGLIGTRLAADPDALAASATGGVLALVGAAGGQRVLAERTNLSAWATLTTRSRLQATGRSCGLGSLTAVGYLDQQALIGGSCKHPGVVGLFARDRGTWTLGGPRLPSPLAQGRVEVLGIEMLGRQSAVLLAVAGHDRISLLAAWSKKPDRWQVSASLPVAPGEQLVSYGPADAGGVFVLLRQASGAEHLAVAGLSASAWHTLAPPPPDSATVAFAPSGPDVFASNGSALTVWSLNQTAGTWHAEQRLHVPIQYGSSNP